MRTSRSVTTRYLPATNTKGARIIARSADMRVTFAYDHALTADGNHVEALRRLCRLMNWQPEVWAQSTLNPHNCHFTSTGVTAVFVEA